MPIIDDTTSLHRGMRCAVPQRLEAIRSAAIILAIPLWLGACSPLTDETTVSTTDIAPGASAEPAQGPPGPVVLAPGLTGERLLPPAAPTRATAPPPAPVTAAAPPPPPPPAPVAAEAAAPPTPAAAPAPIAAAAAPPAVPISCPPGSIAMWSQPDVVGAAVPICHRLNPPR
jgi:hypothetical protein